MLQLSNAFGRKPDVTVTDKSDLASQLRVRRAKSHEFATPRAQTATERASFGDKAFYGLRPSPNAQGIRRVALAPMSALGN